MLSSCLTCGLFAQTFTLSSTNIKTGDSFTPRPGFSFMFMKWDILPENHPLLDSIAAFLVKHDSITIEIGYCSSYKMSEEYSIRLGENRAGSLAAYLTNAGINPKRLTIVDYENTRPLLVDSALNALYPFLLPGAYLTFEYIISLNNPEERNTAEWLSVRTIFTITSTSFRKE